MATYLFLFYVCLHCEKRSRQIHFFSETHSKHPFKAFYTFDFSLKINTVSKEVV